MAALNDVSNVVFVGLQSKTGGSRVELKPVVKKKSSSMNKRATFNAPYNSTQSSLALWTSVFSTSSSYLS